MAAEKMTSYDRVYKALFETSTCQNMWTAIIKDIDSVRVKEVEWVLHPEGQATAKAKFVLTGEAGSWSENEVNVAQLSVYRFLSSEYAKKVIQLHFGSEKDVKTFNCSLNIVKRGGQVSRKDDNGDRFKDHQGSFHDFLTMKLEEDASKEMKVASDKVRVEIKLLMATDEFKQSRHEALVGFCKDTITNALMPWHGMEEQVLRDAWDQFICTAIMDP